jgi:hypothetical protein
MVQANSKTWLTPYPHPQFIVFGKGGKFKREFKQMCENYGIKAKPTKGHNPQAIQSLSKFTRWSIREEKFGGR